MMNNIVLVTFVLLSLLVLISSRSQSSIHPAVNLCKRNDPNISDCYCQNVRTMIPLLKNGAPKMHIPPLDPLHLPKVVMDLSQLHSVHVMANIYNLTVRGLSEAKLPYCYINIDETGIVQHFGLNFLTLTMDANYDIQGSFANFTLNSTGDFHADFSRVFVNTTWKSVKYMKNNKVHLDFHCEFGDIEIGFINIRFKNIFANDPQMDEIFNAAVADKIDILSNEILPIAEEITKSIAEQILDTIFEAFPYDVLIPPE